MIYPPKKTLISVAFIQRTSDHQLMPIAMQVKPYIKDTNDFLKKHRHLSDSPANFIRFIPQYP